MKHRRLLSVLLLLTLLVLAACQPESSPSEVLPDEPLEEIAPEEEAAEPAESEQAEDEEAATATEGEETAAEGAETRATEEDTAAADEGAAGLPDGPVTYVIVPEESTASYIADEEFFQDALAKYGIPIGTKDTVGSTSAIEGQFTLNWSDLSQDPLGENSFTVDLSTLQSDQRLRDSWIRENGPQFDQYPTATFVATELRGAPDAYTMGETVEFQLVGDLTVREVTQPATFDVSASLNGDTVTGTATTTALMSDFGIEQLNFANTLTVADEFQIQVDFTARAQE